MNRLPETNTGVVTSWIPIPTTHPSQPGCESLLWKENSKDLVAWDPGYGVLVNPNVQCLPKPVSTWWLQEKLGPVDETVLSVGPITCPQDYYTATVSKKDSLSTFVACCPSNYSFVKLMFAGDLGQCTSEVKTGATVTYALSEDSTWTTSTSIVTKATTAAAVPVNGWIFATPTDSSIDSTNVSGSCEAAISAALANSVATGDSTCAAINGNHISAGAAAGIGIGVSVGFTGLIALGAALFIMYRTRKTAQNKPPTVHATEFTSSGGKDMGNSAQAFPSTYSPLPHDTPSPSERTQYQQSPVWDASSFVPPSQSSTPHAYARTVPHGEMEGTRFQSMEERMRRRREIEDSSISNTPIQGLPIHSMPFPDIGATQSGSDEEIRRRMELEGEFDRNVKVNLQSPWLTTSRPFPGPSTSQSPPSSQSQFHPPY